MPCVRV